MTPDATKDDVVDVEAINRRVEAATPGRGYEPSRATMDSFASHARTDVPALLTALAAATKEREEAVVLLKEAADSLLAFRKALNPYSVLPSQLEARIDAALRASS